MKHRLVIISEIIAPYRIPVFNALAAREDVDSSILFLSETDPGLRQWRVYKDDIRFRYQVLPSWRCRIADYNVLLNRDVARTLDRLNPEVVVCGGYNYVASWQALRWAKRRGIPFLLWSESNARDIRSQSAPVELLKKRFIASCAGFVVSGKSSREYLKQLGVHERPIFDAPNAVDVSFFSEAAGRARRNDAEIRRLRNLPERYFLYVGRLVPQKGVFELLEAYAKLGSEIRKATGLVFVGDGVARQGLEEKASQIGPGRVVFSGFVHRDELAEFYGLAEALILPTYTDTWGLVVNEAMACGLPVLVSSAAGCVEDLLDHGKNGYVVPPRDVDHLMSAMEHLAENPDLRRQMSGCSVERIRAYSPEKWAEGMAGAAHAVVARSQ
jgi:1,2-diacylglycerol 3-alpha-glucosyltransferase